MDQYTHLNFIFFSMRQVYNSIEKLESRKQESSDNTVKESNSARQNTRESCMVELHENDGKQIQYPVDADRRQFKFVLGWDGILRYWKYPDISADVGDEADAHSQVWREK